MKRTPRSFRALSDLTYAMWTVELSSSVDALLIEFAGEVANSKPTNDAHFMDVVVTAALTAWESQALVLDLRGVRYAWGDWMQNALTSGRRWHRARPQALRDLLAIFGGAPLGPDDFETRVVVSDLCRDGLVSLVRDEVREDPARWLVDSPEEALEAVRRALAGK